MCLSAGDEWNDKLGWAIAGAADGGEGCRLINYQLLFIQVKILLYCHLPDAHHLLLSKSPSLPGYQLSWELWVTKGDKYFTRQRVLIWTPVQKRLPTDEPNRQVSKSRPLSAGFFAMYAFSLRTCSWMRVTLHVTFGGSTQILSGMNPETCMPVILGWPALQF